MIRKLRSFGNKKISLYGVVVAVFVAAVCLSASGYCQTLLSELHTVGGSGDFQYGPGDGTFVIDLSAVPTGELTTMVVKIANDIAASSDTPEQMPEFEIKLERDAGNTGTFVEEDSQILTALGGLASNFYSFTFAPDPSANGDFVAEKVYELTFVMPTGGWALAQGSPSSERLKIGVRNHHPTDPRVYLGVLGATTSEAEVGWIKATTIVDFGEVLVGINESDVPSQLATVANVGTGPLTIASMSDLSGTPFSRGPITPGMILEPFETVSPEINFNPSDISIVAPGPVAENLVVNNNSANEAVFNFPLNATAVKLEVALLFDVSGSMGFRPQDTDYTDPPPDHEDTRIYQAKLASQQLQFLLQQLEGDPVRVGLYTFPEQGVTSEVASADTVVAMKALSLADTELDIAFGNTLSSLQAPKGGYTPMAEGLNEAHGILPTSFASDHWTQGPLVRRALIMLSDGYHTLDSSGSLATPTDWVNYLATITDPAQDIRVFTIGYGQEGITTVDHDTLTDLAGTDGGFYNADLLGTAAINKTFRNALIDWRDYEIIMDPEGTIVQGQGAQDKTVCVDDSVNRMAFVVDWSKVAQNAVDFTLIGPGGVVSASSPDVSFLSTPNSKTFVVKGETLQPGAWTFRLTGGSGLGANESVKYTYSAFGKAKVSLSPKSLGPWVIGSGHLLELTVANPRFVNDKILIEYDLPGESYTTWLSSMEGIKVEWLVDPNVFSDKSIAGQASTLVDSDRRNPWVANKVDLGREASLLDRKVYALSNFADRPFKNVRTTGEIIARDDGQNGDRIAGDRVYTAEMAELRYDGLANIRAVLDWQREGDCLRREVFIDKYIGVALDRISLSGQVSFKSVELSPLFPPSLRDAIAEPAPEGYKRKVGLVKPMQGSIPFGPGKLDRVQFAFENATSVGPLVDFANGEYGQVFQYRSNVRPSVVVTVDGVSSDKIEVRTGGGFNFWWLILILIIVVIIVIFLKRRRP